VKTAFLRIMALVCVLSSGLVTHAWGVTYTYSDIQFPGSISTTPRGINNKGDVVGNYQNSSGVFGFVFSSGDYTTVSCPGATQGTYAQGINDNGVIVGYYSTDRKNYGFVYANGKCKRLPDFNGSAVSASAINNAGVIVGSYFVATDVTHGFELKDGKYTDISAPNSHTTAAVGINAAGVVSGSYYDASGAEYGFLLRGGTYQIISYPSAVGKTQVEGLNDQEFVVGSYIDSSTHADEGFLDRSGKFTKITAPGSVTTSANAINNSGVIVGAYFNGGVNPQGFMATPSAK
jgi:probable HAF family extracellular repeat protein